LLACAVAVSTPAWAAIAAVQANSSCPAAPVGTLSVPFTQAQTAGNLNFIAIGWIDTPRTIRSVTDSKGNLYVPATVVKTGPNSYFQVIYYAKNIVAAAANANSVKVTFDAPVYNLDVRIAEYSGLSTTNALDVTASASGTGTSTDSGAATTTNANDLLVGTNKVENSTTGAGSGFTQQLLTVDGDILERRTVSATGSYHATAPQDVSGAWIMQLVAFRAAGSPAGGDTQAPTAPSGLSATVTAGTPVNLSWTASTDNVGVTAYRVERCQGASCSSFAQVAMASGTTYSDTGLAPTSSYTYRVSAIDAAGNVSGTSTFTLTTPAITYVQGSYALNLNVNSLATTYLQAQLAGDLNVVAVAWDDPTAHVNSVTDSIGNTYTLAVGPTSSGGIYTQSIYYAKNIAAAGALANTVTVAFNVNVDPDVRIAEYSGLDPTTPLDKTASAAGSGTTASAGPVTTTSANEVIVGAAYFAGLSTGAGSGYTLRLQSDPELNMLEDQIVSSIAAYSATAPQDASDLWVMSMATFRAADTQAPTAPTGLTASATSSSQIDLSWTASTDNVAVTGYKIERCTGSSCTTFAEIGTPTSASYSDTGLAAATTYRYRVRATDANTNLSAYSAIVTIATAAAGGDTQAPTAPSGLIVLASSSTEVDLAWTGSTDNVGVTAYLLERCAGASCTLASPEIASPTVTTFNNTGLTPATTYKYRVRARDAANNLSTYSNTVTTVTPASSPDCD